MKEELTKIKNEQDSQSVSLRSEITSVKGELMSMNSEMKNLFNVLISEIKSIDKKINEDEYPYILTD